MRNKMTPAALLFVGGLLGIAVALTPLTIVVFALFLLSVYCIRRLTDTRSASWLIKLLVVGFAIRMLLAVLNYYFGVMWFYHGADTQPDAVIYNSNAFYITSVLRGRDYITHFSTDPFMAKKMELLHEFYGGRLPPLGAYQFNFYVYFLGFLYSLFGYAPIAAKFLNSLFGCLSSVLIYGIAKNLLRSEMTARISAFITMFFPSMVLWSITLLQDSMVNFLFLLYALSLLEYLNGNKKFFVFLAVLACLCLSFLKTKIAILLWMGFVMLLMIKLLKYVGRKKTLSKLILMLAACLVVVSLTVAGHSAAGNFIKKNLSLILETHKASVTTYSSASTFKIYTDDFYMKSTADLADVANVRIIFAVFKAMAYYFLSPFPWDVPYSHPFLLLFYLQVIFTFICLPFTALGIFSAIRYSAAATLSLLTLLAFISLPQAMAEGIIGNVARHRDMFMPFIIMFSCHGFYLLIRPYKNGIELPR